MRVVHRGLRGERILDLDIDDPARTVGDLLNALGSPLPVAAPAAVIDGHEVALHLPLRDVTICEGSVIETALRSTAGAATATTSAGARMLAVSGGIRAGGAIALTRATTIGRSPGADVVLDDPGLEARHLRIAGGTLCDLHSRNGTAIEGHPVAGPTPVTPDASIRAGTSRFVLREPVRDRPVAIEAGLGARGGTIPFNRPPRLAPPTDPTACSLPEPAPEAPPTEPLSVAGIVLPVLAGAVVAVLFSPFMAIFAALGPVLTVGTWWERRRRARRAHRLAMRAFGDTLIALEQRLPALRLAETARRRTLHPEPAEVVRRACDLSVRLWERRRDDPDAFRVGLGVDDERFRPASSTPDAAGPVVAAEANALVRALPAMADVPVEVDLRAGRIVGLVGGRAARSAVARSLVVQMCVHHGPADLSVAVAADDRPAWSWTTWLPHLADAATGRRGAGLLHTDDARDAAALLAALGERRMLAVLDGDDPFQGRSTAGRALLLHESAAALVLVGDAHRLPAGCDRIVHVDDLGWLEIVDPRHAGDGRPALAWGMPEDVAATAARRLARLDDPELPLAGAALPGSVSLLHLLEVDGDGPGEIEGRWRRTDGTADLAVPLGADGEGPIVLDLVADGPHVLVGGTTGSGKSELLRSLVAGVAASADPDHVAMVLIDYKGGAAFDCCADLPHIAGLVTDLDATLAARALQCLEAELHHREERLRAAGAEDLPAFRSAAVGGDPLPRLLVVVDEFASMAADLPDFVAALVGIAQRGRSLGVHLVLATQRPAGVITDDIRANTACRIALRVTDRNDSIDVIDAPDAASIPRGRPGRALARLGPGELVAFQSALATGHTAGRSGITVHAGGAADPIPRGPTDLERLVRAIQGAHRRRGGRVPRSPWPPPLPEHVLRAELAPTFDAALDDWLLVDEPDRQRRRLDGWRPADGHLVVVGGPGCGATTTLATAALAASRAGGHHLHLVDMAGGDLAPLAALPAAGTHAGPTDDERRQRLVRWLDDEVGRRRARPGGASPDLLVVIDDFGGLARAHDPVRDAAIHDRVARIWADGPAVGVVVATSLRRSADLPPALVATAGTVLLHRSADAGDGLRFGIVESLADLPPGRAVRVGDGRHVQVVMDDHTIEQAVAAHAGPPPVDVPHEVGELASAIPFDPATTAVTRTGDTTTITVAIRDRDLQPHPLTLHRGQHALVVGGSRTGRTNMLAAMARAGGDDVIVVGDGDLVRRSGVVPTTPAALDSAIQGRGAVLLLVDDATEVDDPTGALARLAAASSPGVHIVAAVRTDRLRSAYGHWVTEIRSSRVGLLLRPDPIDGDLLGAQLPARLALRPTPGRAVAVVDGEIEVVQVFDAAQSAG
ncbi:MAG: FtsK/SpoIIIE domain-containing protein [Acidimicrobiales bacterium]|nr:FtsK/SpoIIIE domain-containing protein [Acidimicrobiales bacterium]